MHATPLTLLLSLFAVTWSGAAASPATGNEAMQTEHPIAPLPDGLYATFETARGNVTAELFPTQAPLAVANFVGLAEATIAFEGRPAHQPFFDGLIFHRVVEGFVVQGGDPLGTGEGGPGYTFADEFTPHAKHDAAGTLAMANSGPNTNGSQFYFTLSPVNRLNYMHSVFGKVVRGLDVLPHIKTGDGMTRVRITRVGEAAHAYRPEEASFARLRETRQGMAARDASLPPLFVEGAGIEVPEFFPGWLNDKLNHYAHVRGVTIFVRTLPTVDGGSESTTAPSALRILHEQLAGDDPRSATLVYRADEKHWRIWLGTGLLAALDLNANTPPETRDETTSRILAGAAKQIDEGVVRRSIDVAVTDLIEALDRHETGSQAWHF